MASEAVIGMFLRFTRDPESDNSRYPNIYEHATGSHSPTTESVSISISALRSYRCTLEHLPNRHSQQSSRTCPKLVWSTFCEQEQLTTFPLSDSTVSSNWSEVTDDIEVVQNTIEVNNNNIILYNNSIIVFF